MQFDLATHINYKNLLEKGMSEEDALRLINMECRENSKILMQWDDSENEGFTDGEAWFAVNPNYKKLGVFKKTTRFRGCIHLWGNNSAV